MSGIWTHVKGIAGGFAAAFLAYVVIGSLLAAMLAGKGFEECRPQEDFGPGIAVTKCSSALAQAIWFGSVDLPRVAVVVPSLALAMLKVGLLGPNGHVLGQGVLWSIFSAPILFLTWLGFRHWRPISRGAAWGLLVLFIGLVVTRGIG